MTRVRRWITVVGLVVLLVGASSVIAQHSPLRVARQNGVQLPSATEPGAIERVAVLPSLDAPAPRRTTDTRVLRSIPLLDQAALDSVRQWRYTPTLLNGEAVPVILTVTVNFTLTR